MARSTWGRPAGRPYMDCHKINLKMLKNRLIPVLLLRNGIIVQSRGFKRYQPLGNPVAMVRRLNVWTTDELIYLDISPGSVYDTGRDDHRDGNRSSLLGIIRDISDACFMPLTFGGRIRSIDDMRQYLSAGADKVTINTQAIAIPKFISEGAKVFGAQCIVVSIDVKINDNGDYEVYTERGRVPTNLDPVKWAKEVEERGAGEIFLNSIDRDGTGKGYDLNLIKKVTDSVSIPMIVCGGVGEWAHFADGLKMGGVSAVAAANIFNYTEQSVYNAKKYLYENGFNIRKHALIDDTLRDKSSKNN